MQIIEYFIKFFNEHSVEFSTVSSLLLSASIIFSIPFWVYTKLHERKEKSISAYKELITEYTKMMDVFLSNAELDLFSDKNYLLIQENSIEERKVKIIFSMLIALFERAYIIFNTNEPWLRKRYWNEWDLYIKEWACRPLFKKYLNSTLTNSDSEFMHYMNSITQNK